MSTPKPVRFVGKDNSTFYPTLRAKVDAYFKENNLSKHADPATVVKSVVLLTAYLLPLAYMIAFPTGTAFSLCLWALMGIAMAGVGMNVMHDANHGAFSGKQQVNALMGASLYLLGGSVLNWKLQHNVLHHTFTNVAHLDDDIADKPGLRLSPHTEVKKIHRFQGLHAIFIYSLVTLYWVTAKDFLQLSRYTKNGVNKNTPRQNQALFFKLVALKLAYFAFFLGLPIGAGLPVVEVLAGFLLMHLVGGLVLTVIFQLAHTVEETQFPLPNHQGDIENEWAAHQLSTTVNFSRKNKWLTWYLGGLNFQVEHHLFPRICHAHYPKIAPIVQQTAVEFNLPYLEHKNFGAALRSHFSTLKRFGRLPDMDELMG
jgi:linoleoyl-CoA desaturase